MKARLDQTPESQPQSSHMVHAGPNLEHMDLEATDASTQQNPNNNLNNHKNNISSTTTTTSTTTKHRRSIFIEAHSKAVDEIVTDVVDWAMQAPLRARFSVLPAVDIKEILQQWMFEDKSYEACEDYKKLFDALQKSLEHDYSNQLLSDLDKDCQKRRKRRDVPRTPSGSPPSLPPPPPPPAGAFGARGTSGASRYSQMPLPPPPPSTGTSGSARQQSNVENNWASVLVSTYEAPVENSLLAKTGDMTTFMNCNGSSPALSISKIKAASYPDFGLELLVPERMWIDDVYMILRRVKKKSEHTCGFSVSSESKHTPDTDFKNLYPSDFEDLNLLLLQGHLDHLPSSDKRILSTVVKLWTRNLVIRQRVEDFQFGIESYKTQLNLTKPGWDAKGYEFKHDYTIIDNGTLTRILEALAYRVKEFKIKWLNPGMNMCFWTKKDVTRSKEFIAAIERRLKTRRIYRNLECFIGGRVRDIDYRLLQRT
ncbi:hypothetical protein Tco_0337809 [Tanacetum coccineum]